MKLSTAKKLSHYLAGLSLLVFAVLPVDAKVLVYEGFQVDAAESSNRSGWAGQWGLFEGEALVADADISFPMLESTPGLMQFKHDTVTVSQMGELSGEVIYGSFRIYNEAIGNDALLGIAICEPDATLVRPETARMSLLVKGWRVDHGVVIAHGKKEKALGGAPMQAGEAYLVLFKAVNPGGENGSLTMWILNSGQVANLVDGGFDQGEMNQRSLGIQVNEVSQRATMDLPAGKTAMIESGLMFCIISRFNQGALVDEIRMSDTSLAEAAGLSSASTTAVQGIPYISK